MVRIAIIGAGPSGLISARLCLERGHHVTVFEQEAAVGGVWLYSEEIDRHSAMYEELLTNVPKQIMAFPGIPYEKHLPSFLRREHVLEYLQRLSNGTPIRFNSKVINVNCNSLSDKWMIETVDTSSKEHTREIFDVVFVCSGHHHTPIKTLNVTSFKGQYLHSRDYRVASQFKGKRVAVVGAGFSGVDIALQVSDHAEQVFLIGEHATYATVPTKITQFTSRVQDVGKSAISLQDGTVVSNVDVIIECKGFRWDYPFLNKGLITSKFGGRMVSPLWLYFAHRHHPTNLFFIGLNDMTMLLRTMFLQVQFALKLIEGIIKSPSVKEMDQWEAERLRCLMDSKRPAELFHVTDPEQFNYIEELCKMGELERFPDNEQIKKLDEMIRPMRKKDPANYKKCEFVWDGEEYRTITSKL